MRAKFQAALLLSGAVLASAPAHATLIISKGKTTAVSCQSGVCNATAADAVLNVTDLANMLATSDVKVFAEGIATDINVSDPFSWTSSHKLTLGAYGDIAVKAAITAAGTSGVTIAANVAQTGGVFKLVGTGKIIFWDTASSLIINNVNYTLINNLPALVNAIATNASGDYALANDYDASQDGSYPHSPIPTAFNGIFEGLGNAFNNLSIFNSNAGGEQIALFANVGAGGQLNDVNLVNVSIQATNASLAPLAALNSGTITHASASGAISSLTGGNFSVAGLVMDNEAAITRSHAGVNISGAGNAGGLATTNGGTITLSDASGSVSAASLAGGLVGYSTGTVATSFATGSVAVISGRGAAAGGLVAQLASGSVQQSFATGAVQGGTFDRHRNTRIKLPPKPPGNALGGLVGTSYGAIYYSYATGSVSEGVDQDGPAKHASVGGVVGVTFANASVLQDYALGKLSIGGEPKYLGGVIGTDNTLSGSNTAGLWDLDTTGVVNKNQGAGNQFNDKGLNGFADAKFRKAALRHFNLSIWAEDAGINNGYPYLTANPPQ